MSAPSPIIILTGASRGLGLAALTSLLSTHNARVTALSRSFPPALAALAEQYGPDRLQVIQGDVGDVAVNADAVQRTVRRWGGVDGIVCNAGSLEPLGRIADLPLDQLASYSLINLHSALYLIQPALPYLRASRLTPVSASAPSSSTPGSAPGASSPPSAGRIVLTSSGASQSGYAGWSWYCMAKAGLNALARVLAVEEKEHGVAVWAVRPGVINTDVSSLLLPLFFLVPPHLFPVERPMQRLLRETGPGVMHPDHLKKFQGMYDNNQLLDPEDPGAVLAGLAVAGPHELSGEYIDWADERLVHLRREKA